jgi:hypothetical protein
VIQHIDVHAVLRESFSGLYADLVTRPTGRVVRERIEQVMAAGAGRAGGDTPAIARMDFTGVGCLDYSCADEIIAKPLRAWPALLVLRGLSEGHREAIEPVLARRGLAVVLEEPDGTLEILGTPALGAALLEQLVVQRLAGRLPGGTFALIAT